MNQKYLKAGLLAMGIWVEIFSGTVIHAEPFLKLAEQPVSGRITPAPFAVEDYHGSIRQGYENLQFMAPGGDIRWDAWIDPQYMRIARAAMDLIEKRALDNPECDRYYADNMPHGKTFSQIWKATGSERIRISFSPGPSATWRAATYRDSAPYEWTITETTIGLGTESVASAMVHEATRTNGIGAEFQIAYQAERVCGMKQYILDRKLIKDLGWRVFP